MRPLRVTGPRTGAEAPLRAEGVGAPGAGGGAGLGLGLGSDSGPDSDLRPDRVSDRVSNRVSDRVSGRASDPDPDPGGGGLYDADLLEALRRGAEGLLPGWGLSPRARLRLLNVSENATFLAEDPEAEAPIVLRVHRPGYHTRAEIRSELAWIDALRADRTVEAPAPLPRRDGALIAGFEQGGERRDVVAFSFLTGVEPTPDAGLVGAFGQLGEITARLHLHARRWTPPAGFARKTWDFDGAVGAVSFWGDWRDAAGLDRDGRATLERLSDALRARLAAYGTGADRFGLIHADLRLANLLVDGDRLGVIDFDDCGYGWHAYDFAAAISFIERDPLVPALLDAWLEGYARAAAPPPGHAEAIPDMILLRRLLLTAWLASHPETPTARALGADFAAGTVEMAERSLSGRSPIGF